MFMTKRTITANKDITPRFAKNFVAEVAHIKSNLYFIVGDREINAKSILGIISINIMNYKMEKTTAKNKKKHILFGK